MCSKILDSRNNTCVIIVCIAGPGTTEIEILERCKNHFVLKQNNNKWSIIGPTVFIKQRDGNSHGPMACLKLMDVFGLIPEDIDDLDLLSGVQLMNCYANLRERLDPELRDPVPRRNEKNEDGLDKSSDANKQTLDKTREMSESDDEEKPSPKKKTKQQRQTKLH